MYNKFRKKINKQDVLAKLVEISFSPLLSHIETKKVKVLSDQPPSSSPVFIVGTPRSGSTLLYQLMVNHFDLLYISNFIHIFNYNLYTAFKWYQRLFPGNKLLSLESKFGNTMQQGWRGPSECAKFWYRYLPKNKHHIKHGEMPLHIIQYYHEQIYAVINTFHKPLLFKNLNAGQRLGFIKELAPNARIIFLKRDPYFNAQSLLLARKTKKIRVDEMWSVKPPNFDKLLQLDEPEMTVAQIYYLEKQIFEDSAYFEMDHWLTIRYESLGAQTEDILQNIADFLNMELEFPDKIGNIHCSDRIKVQEETEMQIRKAIEKYDWKKYTT